MRRLRVRIVAVFVVAVVGSGAVVLVSSDLAFAQPGGFVDVPEDVYYSVPVDTLAERGVFVGTECEEGFCPGVAMDRKTMAVWIVRVLDDEDPGAVFESRFGDVDAESFHAPFVERLAELGVTEGCGDGMVFCPDRSVTRAQMAAFLSRAYGLADGPDPGFADVPSDVWYAVDVARLVASGITVGCGDGTVFCPGRDTTRAQMATFLYRAENRRASAAACDVLRRTPGYVYPGAPAERVDVIVVSVGFDDLGAPDFRLGDVLAGLEAQLEALSHGRTDFVFHRGGMVALSGSVRDRVGRIAGLFSGLTGLPRELRHLRGDAAAVLAFVSIDGRDHSYVSFLNRATGVAVVGVRQLRGDENVQTGATSSRPLTEDEKVNALRRGEESAQHSAAHELLHVLGLDDLYEVPGWRGPGSSIMGLDDYHPSAPAHGPHEFATGWNKWLLGWLDGPDEVQCVTVDGPTRVVLRPHQQVAWELFRGGGRVGECYWWHLPTWGSRRGRPAVAIVPTSATTALVVEADPLGGFDDFPACGLLWPPDSAFPQPRPAGDAIIYSVDTTVRTGNLPLRVLHPSQALITEAQYEIFDQYVRSLGLELSAAHAYTTELVAAGYRITIAERTTTDDGLAQVTVIIEPA